MLKQAKPKERERWTEQRVWQAGRKAEIEEKGESE